jgi:hypothetical protein
MGSGMRHRRNRYRAAMPLYGVVIAKAKYGKPCAFIRDELGARYLCRPDSVKGSLTFEDLVPGIAVIFRGVRHPTTQRLLAEEVYRR